MNKNAEQQAKFKSNQINKGLVRLGVDWVTQQQKDGIKSVLRGESKIVKLKGKE
jgi:hypothetical protein